MIKLNTIQYSCSKVYRVGGVTFEWEDYLGPCIINRHTEKQRPFRNISNRNWSAIRKFQNMTTKQREWFRLY